MSATSTATQASSPPVLRGRSPVAGLDRRSLGPLPVLAQSVSAVAPAAAMASTPALVTADAGTSALWSVALAALLALLVSVCVRTFSIRMAAPGALYSFTAKGLGPAAAFACGCALLIGYGVLAMGALTGAGLYAGQLFARLGMTAGPPELLVALVLLTVGILTAYFLVRGVRLSAGLTLFLEAASIVLALAFFAVLLVRQGPHPDMRQLKPPDASPAALASVVAGALPAFGAFIGFESATVLGAEARRPFLVVGRAVRWTVVCSAGLYLLATYTQVLAAGSNGVLSPLGEFPDHHSAVRLPVLLDLGIAISFFACAVASGTALVRLLFSMGRERMTPRQLGRTHPTHGTPHIAVSFVLPILVLVPLGLLTTGLELSTVFTLLLSLCTYGFLTAYALVCVAAPAFLHRIGELTRAPVAAAAVCVPFLLLVLAAHARLNVSAGNALLPGLFAVLMGAGMVWFLLARRRDPERVGAIGVYDETSAQDVLHHVDSRRAR
ncbi:APC family permease [Streptomyces sp. NPDC001315]|uniref:APC family permease n=1 Tax=Streptomyces sp. NPDC001315 TaxID=3364562 RepID=UPI00368E419E